MSIILTFSKRGPEFFRFMEGRYISEEKIASVEKIEAENAEYAKALGSQPGDGDK